jgi:cell division protein ZapA
MDGTPPDRQSVRVTILSRPYTLLASGDPRETEEVAASVNDLMMSIAAKAPNADSTRIAVLASLHLADRLRSLERDLSHLRERIDRKSGEFSDMLERLIVSATEHPGRFASPMEQAFAPEASDRPADGSPGEKA